MRGWLFDLYPGEPGEMVVWLKSEGGRPLRLVDRWAPSLFVASDDVSLLKAVAESTEVRSYSARTRLVERYERITDGSASEVLEVVVKDAKKLVELGRRIERAHALGSVRIYNCDVPPAQSYLYEKDVFPLALCDVSDGGDGLAWRLRDDAMSYDYEAPPLRSCYLGMGARKSGRIAKLTDPIDEAWLGSGEEGEGREPVGGSSESEKILRLVERVRERDPDLLLTRDGDTFLFPYLIARAAANGLSEALVLGRDQVALRPPERAGTSYFSYGKILFKPSSVKLYGRVHLDASSSFSYSHSGMEGLFELSRVCRQPLHTSSRASIGKALSSLQFYHAARRGVLIPWKPTLAERFKDRSELLTADRGGFIFEPHPGVYDGVGELDFSSLFPSIMLRKNISAETVGCSCCPDSGNVVPELGWRVCEKTGITPETMKVIVNKRLEYKRRKGASRGEARRRYDGRQGVLKWLGVTCLPRESRVFVRQDGVDKLVRIGDFIDSLVGDGTGAMGCPPGVFVAGAGHDYKTKYSKVVGLVKKPNSQRLISVEMEDGRKIVTTPDHPFFTLREGELKVVCAEKLRAGEVIPVATKIPSASSVIEQIDLIDQLGGLLSVEEERLWRVSGECLKDKIRAQRKSLIKAATSEGYSYQAVVRWIKSGIVPLRFLRLLDLAPDSHQKLRIGVGRRGGGRIAWLPAVIKVDGSLGFLLGLYVSDGSFTNTYVRFDIASSEPELLTNTKELVESLFGISPRIYKERKAEMYVVQVNSASIVKVLEKVIGLPGSAEKGKLKVPDIVFNCAEQTAQRFLAGLVAGDGSVSRGRRFVNISTASKDFQNQIGFLSARLGLVFRLATHREHGGSLYTVNFVGPETLRTIASWEYSKENQRTRIQSWSEESPVTCNHARYVRLPASESGLFLLAKTTRTSSKPHVYAKARTCPSQATKKIRRMRKRRLNEAQSEELRKIDRLLNGDLGFVRIRKIEVTDRCPEYVYCFQLAEDEVPGFFTGEGLVFTHNCFGYLGFNNAKFGRIDAHIAVCAWDRKILLDSMRIAERRGFRVIHGIVDSLWLKKEGAGREEYEELKAEIERETGFQLSFEGIYKWIAFLNSRTDPRLAVQNRYFGSRPETGVKVRGIEARRHDTPELFRRCQEEILEVMDGADSVAGVRATLPACVEVFLRYAGQIGRKEIPVESMVFTKNISKDPEEYLRGTVEAQVVRMLLAEGARLHQGESISYVITDYYARTMRALPADALDGERRYDTERYVEMLADACSTLLRPFDGEMTAERLLELLRRTEAAVLTA